MTNARFAPSALQAAIHATLNTTVPPEHGVATVVDLNGAHVALGTRVKGGWELDVNAGYDWTGKGFDGTLKLGKSW